MSFFKVPNFSRNPWRLAYSRYLFIIISFLQGVIVISLEAVIYSHLNNDGNISTSKSKVEEGSASNSDKLAADSLKSLLVYLVLFMFSQVFQVALSIESVYNKNTLQIFGILGFNFMTFIYSIFQLFQLYRTIIFASDGLEDIKNLITIYVILVALVIGTSEILIGYFGFKLYKEFGWSIYRIIGSDISMRRMLLMYHSFLMVLKFDVFFFIGFIIQFLVLVLEVGNEYYLTIAAVPIIVAILWLGVLGVKKENKFLLGLNLIGFFLGTIYFTYKIVRIWTRENYVNFRYFMTLFAILSLIFLIVSFVLGVICLRQFGKGLDKYISKQNFVEEEKRRQEPIDLGDE